MKQPGIDPQLDPYFEEARMGGVRKPERAEAGKAAFLAEARHMAEAVSAGSVPRLNHRQSVGKERFSMIRIAGSILLALSLVAGGGGVTVAAAQESMPGDALYPVKLWSEDAYLAVTTDPQEDMNLALQFADRRAEEIVHLVAAGDPVANEVLLRMAQEDDMALGIAAGLGGEDSAEALEKVRERLEVHERVLTYAGQGPSETALTLQVRDQIRQRLELFTQNQGDQNQLQEQIRLETQDQQQVNQPESQGAGPQGDGTGASAEGGAGYGNGGPDEDYNCTCHLVSGKGAGSGAGQAIECDCEGDPQSGIGKGGYGGGNGNR